MVSWEKSSDSSALASRLSGMATQIQEWFEKNIDGFTYNGAATKAGLNMSTVRRHLISDEPSGQAIETIIQICRAYGLNPLPALVAAGALTAEEADSSTPVVIQDIPETQLLSELMRRSKSR